MEKMKSPHPLEVVLRCRVCFHTSNALFFIFSCIYIVGSPVYCCQVQQLANTVSMVMHRSPHVVACSVRACTCVRARGF